MSIAIINEILEKSAELTSEERRELMRLLQEQELEKQAEERAKKRKPSDKKGFVHPNTIWMKENSHKYKGLYVALYEGELIATGKTIKEADLAAKAKGYPKTLLHRILRDDEEAWCGW